MSVITSVNGDVQFLQTAANNWVQLREVTKWTWEAKVNVHQYASNFTAGVRRRLRGSKEATGKVNGVYDPLIPVFRLNGLFPGVDEDYDGFFRFFFTTAHFIQCPVMVDKLDFTEDIDNGNIIEWTLEWGANGVWTYPAALVPLVAQAANLQPGFVSEVAKDMKIDDEDELNNIAKVAQLVGGFMKSNPGCCHEDTNCV